MVRSKVKLAYIRDDSRRKAAYKKRSKGMMKKASELSTLCDVQSCAIIYGPYSPEPKVWPSPEGAREVLERFRGTPGYQQGVRMKTQESFTNERIKKAEDKLAKLQMENRHKEISRLMFKWLRGEGPSSNPNLLDLVDMVAIAEEKIREIASAIEQRKKENLQSGQENTDGLQKGNHHPEA